MLIIPEENRELRSALLRLTEHREQEAVRAILDELYHGQATIFIHVVGKKGAEGEPPITAEDICRRSFEGLRLILILATTCIEPEAPVLAANNVFCRPIPAPELMRMCLERGILAIQLDLGRPTGVVIGPIGKPVPMKVVPECGLYAYPNERGPG